MSTTTTASTILDDPDVACPSCGTPRRTYRCHRCHRSAELIDCGHLPQPRPIAPDAAGVMLCDDCADAARPAARGAVADAYAVYRSAYFAYCAALRDIRVAPEAAYAAYCAAYVAYRAALRGADAANAALLSADAAYRAALRDAWSAYSAAILAADAAYDAARDAAVVTR